MTVHRCDICRSEHADKSQVATVFMRANLETLAKDQPNYVAVELDICVGSAPCMAKGFEQATRELERLALDRCGVKKKAA